MSSLQLHMALKRSACSKASSRTYHYIEDFVWKFCMNDIPLNSVTWVVAYTIPHCDNAVGTSFGGSKLWCLVDATSGYHQMRVAPHSHPKLVFAGTRGTKFTYNVMPFGPVNSPVFFIIFIHDMNQTWKEVTTSQCFLINAQTNTTIIIRDIFS